MSKVAVVYWSGTGNTAAMAAAVAEGQRQREQRLQFSPVQNSVQP